jgi:hypothetical protein
MKDKSYNNSNDRGSTFYFMFNIINSKRGVILK